MAFITEDELNQFKMDTDIHIAIKTRKGKKKYLYGAFIQHIVSRRSDMDHTVFTCKLHDACLFFVSLHQMVPPLYVVANI